MMKQAGVFLLALVLMTGAGVPALAALPEAQSQPTPPSALLKDKQAQKLTTEQGAALVKVHKSALAVYKKVKDSHQAIRLLENAGIKSALENQPEGLRDETYVELLNDYGFFLSETPDRLGEAIQVLEKVVQLKPDRAVARLNLGDVFVKEIAKNPDAGAKQEFRELALEQYRQYAELLNAKKQGTKMPARVRAFLERADARGKKVYRYELVMNKEKDFGSDVCTHMLGLYNADFQKYNKVRYDEHPEFASIRWEVVRNLSPDLAYKSDEFLMARFDINNDGVDDLVIKEQWSLRGLMDESLSVFKNTPDAPVLGPSIGINELNKREGEIGAFETNEYYLEAIKGREKGFSLIGPFRLHPFVYQGRGYISMNDYSQALETNLYEADFPQDKWLVVSSYKRAKELEDICYFRLISKRPPKNTTGEKGR